MAILKQCNKIGQATFLSHGRKKESEHFTCQDSGLAKIFKLIVASNEEILNNVTIVMWRQVK